MKSQIRELDEGFNCECGEHHEFGVYVAAHWTERLIHTCQKCGAVHIVARGVVTLKKAGRAVAIGAMKGDK